MTSADLNINRQSKHFGNQYFVPKTSIFENAIS